MIVFWRNINLPWVKVESKAGVNWRNQLAGQKTHAEKTAADDKSIGFDYQYYYFLHRVLKLGKRQSVGLEVKDDVHTELENEQQILIQLKHTTQRKFDGSLINLTTFDSDLWKTLSNWSKVISDKGSGRNTEKSQLQFVGRTEFMLVTNKSQTSTCRFFNVLETNKDSRKQLKLLKSQTKDSTIKKYIQDVLNLSDPILIAFFAKIHLEHDVEDVIMLCKESIAEHHVPDDRVEKLFRDLDSQIRQDNFISIKNGEKIIISFSDFSKKYRRFFDLARNPDLKISEYHESLPANLKDLIFIRQLTDIGDLSKDDVEDMSDYTRYMLTVKTNLLRWQSDGDLTSEEVTKFNGEAKMRWQNRFRAVHREKDKNDGIALALKVLDEIRMEKLMLGSQYMGTEFSNGEYYYLSDIPEIGWLLDWETKYK
jgi:hypothetical protein